MAFIDYYKIMGIPKDTPQSEIRKAYTKRARQFHPDLHPDDPKAKAKFQALNEANAVLSDPEKRRNTINTVNSGSRPMLLRKQEDMPAEQQAVPLRRRRRKDSTSASSQAVAISPHSSKTSSVEPLVVADAEAACI